MKGINKKSSSVRQLIIRTSDQLQAGELSLIEVTPAEKKAAKARLDTQCKKRRERDAKTKQSLQTKFPKSFDYFKQIVYVSI